ncbi:hypothetical protein LCGC14_0392830 [marine sediment metagenome]|uniref:Bacteriophage Mu GpT domain-containing protein n=1 Tax=marine sediment metagenome TaxID=412755 RepID=A0A0F9TH17_9ZZZZ
MASSGGHWATLAEAQKLTQSTKIPGVFEEDIKRNNPVERMPVAQAAGTGLKIEWLRESSTTEDAVVEADIGDQLSWAEDITYTEVESTLRYIVIQRKLDRYVQNIYGSYNDYRVQVLLESEKGLIRKVGDRVIYADTTYGGLPTQFDGYHALAAERGTPWAGSGTTLSRLNMDMGNGALSLLYLRTQIDQMRYGVSEILIPPQLGIRFDAAYQERGFTYAVSSNETNHFMMLTQSVNEIGRPILFFMGIPLVRTDYLVQEDDGTGTGATSDKRDKGTDNYSLFCVKYGNVMAREAGVTYAFGGTEGTGDLYELWTWERLEGYNAGGMRLDNYGTVLLGSTLNLGRIIDISDAAIVA